MACQICNGVGAIRRIELDGTVEFINCECQTKNPDKAAQRIKAARIPELYCGAELSTYETGFSSCSVQQKNARLFSDRYVAGYPVQTNGRGLVFYGPVGTGKTHLAIGILKELIRKGFTGIYYDNLALIKLLQSTIERDGITEWDVLQTAIGRDVLLLDDLGAFKLSDYTDKMMTYIMNERYSHNRVTIITTNYPFEPPLLSRRKPLQGDATEMEKQKDAAERAVSRETLGDRVGERVFDRLLQMCVPLEVTGNSMRATVLKARFG